MNNSVNNLLNIFINLIRDLEVSKQGNFFYNQKNKYKIKKTKYIFFKDLKSKQSFNVNDLQNLTALLNTIHNMKILKSLEINSYKSFNLSSKIYKTDDITFLGITTFLKVFSDDEQLLDFHIKTKQSQLNNTLIDIDINIFSNSLGDYGPVSDIKSNNLKDLKIIQKNSKESIMSISFKMIYNIFTVYYDQIFNSLERRYLK